MGGTFSKHDHSITNENVIETITKSLQQSSQTIGSENSTLQSNDIGIGTLNIGECKFTTSNFAEVKQVTTGKFSAENIVDISTEVQNDLVQNYKKKLEQTTDAGFSVAKDVDDGAIKNSVEKATSSSLTQESIQDMAAEIVVIQDNKVKFENINCPPGSKGTVEITNKLVADQITEAIMENIQTELNKSEILSDIDSKYDLMIEQENKGIFGSFDNFVNAVKGLFQSMYFIIGAVIIVFLLIFLFAFKTPAAQHAAMVAANTGATMYGGPAGMHAVSKAHKSSNIAAKAKAESNMAAASAKANAKAVAASAKAASNMAKAKAGAPSAVEEKSARLVAEAAARRAAALQQKGT